MCIRALKVPTAPTRGTMMRKWGTCSRSMTTTVLTRDTLIMIMTDTDITTTVNTDTITLNTTTGKTVSTAILTPTQARAARVDTEFRQPKSLYLNSVATLTRITPVRNSSSIRGVPTSRRGPLER